MISRFLAFLIEIDPKPLQGLKLLVVGDLIKGWGIEIDPKPLQGLKLHQPMLIYRDR